MDIQASYDSSATAAPSWFKSAVDFAIAKFDALIANPISLTINFGWGEENGKAIRAGATAQNQSSGTYMSYKDLTAAMAAHATSAVDGSVIANLPAADPTNGGKIYVPLALQQALGVGTAVPAGTVDGYIGLDSSLAYTFSPTGQIAPKTFDAVSIIEHELSEVLGRVGSLGSVFGKDVYAPMDLFRYAAPGQRALTPGGGSFSIDGQTMLGSFNDPTQGGDAADWSRNVAGDTFGDSAAGVPSHFSTADYTILDALGYTLTPEVSFDPTVSFPTAGTVVLTGTVSDPAGHVELYANDTDLGAATVSADGSWSLQAALPSQFVGALSAVVTGSDGLSATIAAPAVLLGSLHTARSGLQTLAAGSNFISYTGTQNADGTTTYDYNSGNFFNRARYSRDTVIMASDGSALQETKYLKNGHHDLAAIADGQTMTALGNDTLAAYGSNDTFVFNAHPGQEVVTAFNATGRQHDTLSFSAASFSSVADILHAMTSSGNDTIIRISAIDSVTLQNISPATLKANAHDFRIHG